MKMSHSSIAFEYYATFYLKQMRRRFRRKIGISIVSKRQSNASILIEFKFSIQAPSPIRSQNKCEFQGPRSIQEHKTHLYCVSLFCIEFELVFFCLQEAN